MTSWTPPEAAEYFLANTNRRESSKVSFDRDPLYLERIMMEQGYALAWNGFNYLSHMKKAAVGDCVLAWVKGKGFVAIGEVTKPLNEVRRGERRRLVPTFLSEEWQLEVSWKWYVTPDNAYYWMPGKCSFKHLKEEVYGDIRRAAVEHILRHGNPVPDKLVWER